MKLNTKKCIGCEYWRHMSGIPSCHYMIYTGLTRGGTAETCTVRKDQDGKPYSRANHRLKLKKEKKI